MKRATFRDAQIVARARAERRRKTQSATVQPPITRPRTQTIPGYRIQPMLPISCGQFGAVCEAGHFTEYDGTACVEASVRLGNGMVKQPYTLVLSIEQALDADIIERVPGCRCEVCGGRDDDPAGIHGRKRSV